MPSRVIPHRRGDHLLRRAHKVHDPAEVLNVRRTQLHPMAKDRQHELGLGHRSQRPHRVAMVHEPHAAPPAAKHAAHGKREEGARLVMGERKRRLRLRAGGSYSRRRLGRAVVPSGEDGAPVLERQKHVDHVRGTVYVENAGSVLQEGILQLRTTVADNPFLQQPPPVGSLLLRIIFCATG